jgi:hypothetical protein
MRKVYHGIYINKCIVRTIPVAKSIFAYMINSSKTLVVPAGRKVIAHDVVNVRAARGGEHTPVIVTIPKKIVDAMKLKKGESLRVYTDGERIYLDRFEEPVI